MYQLILILGSLIVSVKAGEFYTTKNGNSFFVENVLEFKWYDAIKLCASKNLNLIAPDTEEKYLEIMKLIPAVTSDKHFWTAGQEAENFKFVWNTTGNEIEFSKWHRREPIRDNDETQCIGMFDDGWTSYTCMLSMHVICEENPTIKELNKMKIVYENETNTILEELRQLRLEYNECKRNFDSCDLQRTSEFETLRKSHENDKKKLLEEWNREVSVLKMDCEKQLNQLTLANKIQENEMLKEFHAKEHHLLEEQQNYTLNSLKTFYDILTNHTNVTKSYNIMFNVHGNRN